MNEEDIDTFLRAKRETRFTYLYSSLALFFMAMIIFMEVTHTFQEWTILIVTLAMLSAAAIPGPSRGVTVSRSKLMDIIERQINSDPELLKMLADRWAG